MGARLTISNSFPPAPVTMKSTEQKMCCCPWEGRFRDWKQYSFYEPIFGRTEHILSLRNFGAYPGQWFLVQCHLHLSLIAIIVTFSQLMNKDIYKLLIGIASYFIILSFIHSFVHQLDVVFSIPSMFQILDWELWMHA